MLRLSLVSLTFVACAPGVVSGQGDSPGWRDRFRFGGEVSGAFARTDVGYFNQLEYVSSALRLVSSSLSAQLRASDRLSIVGELRTFNFERVEPYALYVRFRPWRERVLDLQVGRIPTVFGAYGRRQYSYENPLIGYPLLYQYPTNVRADAAPADFDELRRARGRGAKTSYTVGSPYVSQGLSVVAPLVWDTGVEARLGDRPLQLSVSLTQGTLGNPRFSDDNSGKQLAGRLQIAPAMEVVVGLSGARGRYDSSELRRALEARGADEALYQPAVGADVELSRGHVIVRAEAVWNRWDRPLLEGRYESFGGFVEARYKLMPGLYAAARLDRLGFSEVGPEDARFTWDAPVTRVEGGVGYYWRRRLLTKLTLQHNERDGGNRTSGFFLAAQAAIWF